MIIYFEIGATEENIALVKEWETKEDNEIIETKGGNESVWVCCNLLGYTVANGNINLCFDAVRK